jgi:hypothetical protein
LDVQGARLRIVNFKIDDIFAQMEANTLNADIKKAWIVFWFNLILSIISLVVLIKVIDTNNGYRIIAASIGFLILISFTVLVFARINKLRKAASR